MIKKSTSRIVLIYGIIIAGLGYLGYYQSQSKASLWAGLGSGTILILSSLLMFANRSIGIYIGLATTLLLSGIFGYRYAATQGNLPALLSILSGAMLIYLLIQIGHWKK